MTFRLQSNRDEPTWQIAGAMRRMTGRDRMPEFRSLLSRVRVQDAWSVSHAPPSEAVAEIMAARDRIEPLIAKVGELEELVQQWNEVDDVERFRALVELIQIELPIIRGMLERSPVPREQAKGKVKGSFLANAHACLQRELNKAGGRFRDAVKRRAEKEQQAAARRQSQGVMCTPSGYDWLPTAYSGGERPVMQRQCLDGQRAQSVQAIEQQVIAVSDLFQEVADVVASADEVVERIDENTEMALRDVEEGERQLKKFFEKVKKNRRVALLIMVAVAFFAIIFVFIW